MNQKIFEMSPVLWIYLICKIVCLYLCINILIHLDTSVIHLIWQIPLGIAIALLLAPVLFIIVGIGIAICTLLIIFFLSMFMFIAKIYNNHELTLKMAGMIIFTTEICG